LTNTKLPYCDIKLWGSEPLQVQSRSSLHSVCSMQTTVSRSMRSRSDEACEVYRV